MKDEPTLKALKRESVKIPEDFEMSVWSKITGKTWATKAPWKRKAKKDAEEEPALLWISLPWVVACMALFVGVELGVLHGIDYNSNAHEQLSTLYTSSINPSDDNPYL